MHKLSYQAFYTTQGLETLQKRFEAFLEQSPPPQDIVEKAIVLEDFLAVLFGIQEEVNRLQSQEKDARTIFKCKRHFVQRHVKPFYKKAPSVDGSILRHTLSDSMGTPFKGEELLFATHVLRWLDNSSRYEKALKAAADYSAWALFSKEGQSFYRGKSLFHLQEPVDVQNLFPITKEKDGTLKSTLFIPRKGFNHTDQTPTGQSHPCLICHRQEKDSCRKGIANQKNSLGEMLDGCPLDQKISEMMQAKQLGQIIAALAIITVDNPMVAATGRRICNACSKACIFQKQTPVDVPSVETEILEAVLSLPWGFEIYSLLTRWNPLKKKNGLPSSPTNKKVLVVGMGPSGFALSHHLLQEGHTVLGIDGLTIQSLPERLKEPHLISNIKDFFDPLDHRKVRGFGGVADYGITARWNKNFLLVLRLILERNDRFLMRGNTRLESTLTTEQAFGLGFDHVALCMGAGKPNMLPFPNALASGVMQATDFLMRLHVQGLSQQGGGYPPLLQSPIVVIGSGLTAVDAATEARAYYALQEKMEPTDPRIDVKILYRKSIQESPAYRKNHEELKSALEEGVGYLEHKDPQEFLLDQEDHIDGILCRDGTILPARTILMAIGTNPQTVIAEERPDLFERRGQFLKIHRAHTPFTTAMIDSHRFISVLGDLHPDFSGSVVHALASAKKAAPYISEKLSAHEPQSSLATEDFFDQVLDQLTPRLQSIQKEETRTRLKVCAPLAAKNLKLGQFFRLQVLKNETLLETIPLMGIKEKDDSLVFFLNHSSKVDSFLRDLSLDTPLFLMGPTGDFYETLSGKNVLVLGPTMHKEVLEYFGTKLEQSGCTVSYHAESCQGFDEIFTIGLSEHFLRAPHVPKTSALVPTKMYCMMKGICAQCLRKSKDPETGNETFVFGCQKSIEKIGDPTIFLKNLQRAK